MSSQQSAIYVFRYIKELSRNFGFEQKQIVSIILKEIWQHWTGLFFPPFATSTPFAIG